MYKLLITILLSISLWSCNSQDPGSGGGIGGTGITPIVASGATQGAISEFGSIVVNGIRFNTDDAAFFTNDNPITQGELRVGMNVLAAVDFETKQATQVDYVPSLIGPVESVDVVSKSFKSLGQTIRLGGGTTFNNISLAEIAPGIVVEVSGLRNATGVIFATFIRPAQDTSRYQMVGAILSDLGNTQQLSLNGLQVNIAQADSSQLSADELAFGSKVYITANASTYDPTQNLISADSIRVALEPMVSVGERVEVEGIVSTFTSPSEFDVYWQPITTNNQTRVEFQDGTLGNLSMILLNTRLEVEGIVQTDGSYHATKIVLIPTENAKLDGVIEQITPDGNTFTVVGQTIRVDNNTRFDGSTFAELRAGDYVEIEAAYLGDRLVATEVEVDDFDERAILEGPITRINIETAEVFVMNQPIVLGIEVSYENQDDQEISRQEFIEQLQPGVIVKARWDDFQSVGLVPDDLSIE